MSDSIELKWGTLKGWDLESEKARELIRRYCAIGSSFSAMAQRDTPEQKAIICELIDIVDGEIWNDWDGVVMTKDDAKSYVLNYGKQV